MTTQQYMKHYYSRMPPPPHTHTNTLHQCLVLPVLIGCDTSVIGVLSITSFFLKYMLFSSFKYFNSYELINIMLFCYFNYINIFILKKIICFVASLSYIMRGTKRMYKKYAYRFPEKSHKNLMGFIKNTVILMAGHISNKSIHPSFLPII